MEKLNFLFFSIKSDQQSKKNHWFYLVLFGLFSSVTLSAQSGILQNYVQVGLDSNLALKSESLNIEKQLEILAQSKALFRPNVSFNASYTLAGGGRTIDLPLGDLFNPVYSALNQQLPPTNQFPMLSNQSTQFLPNNFHETKFRVIQPLFNSDIYYGYKANEELISVQKAKKKVYEQELTKLIKQAYFQYLQAEKVISIYAETQKLLAEILRVNNSLIANDKATREIVYGTEYEISKVEQEIVKIKNNRKVARSYFNFLLNRDLEAEIEVDEQLMAKFSLVNADLAKSESDALKQRAEFEQLQAAMNAQSNVIEMKDKQKLPTVALVGDLGYQGFGYEFDSNQDFWLVQVSLKWNIYQGGSRKSALQQAKIEQSLLQNKYEELESQIGLQVRQAFYAYQTAVKSVQTAQAGLKSAEQNYKFSERKHREGLLPSFQLLDTQTKLTNAKLSLTISRFDVLMKQAELERVAGS
ncbi:MAG: outer membrane protein TolC [Flammeovirgaceae bacterium]|jgi:outer membrane protein